MIEFVEIKKIVLLRKNRNTVEELDEDKILAAYYDRTAFEAS